jgi:ubiquitin C
MGTNTRKTRKSRKLKKQIAGIKRKSSRISKLIMKGGMKLYVDDFKKKERIIDLEVENSDTIEQIRDMIFEHTGIRPNEQRLVFNSKSLEDTSTLAEYKIQRNSTIFLLKRISIYLF